MNKQEIKLNCEFCGRKIGVVTIFSETANILGNPACCVKCLPSRLKKLEREGYNDTVIEDVRKWLKT